MPTDQLTFRGPKLPNVGTQQRRTIDILLGRRWTCGTALAAEVSWAFGSRLSELKRAGWPIEKRKCCDPNHHHRAVLYEYGLVDERVDGGGGLVLDQAPRHDHR